MTGFERADALDGTARELLAMFAETVVGWDHANLPIGSLYGRPLPPLAAEQRIRPVDELGRALALELMRWAAEAAADAEDDPDRQIALIRESYELGLTTLVDVRADGLDVLYGLRLLFSGAPWGSRIRERRLRDIADGDIGQLLTELEELRVIRRADERIWFACW